VKPIFEWDPAKAAANLKKHGVSFREATTVLTDPLSITVSDPDHSNDEERYIDVGLSAQGRIVVVVYTERGTRIRVISARKATAAERRRYEESYS
jgi:uncharacterized DUF497 family protein